MFYILFCFFFKSRSTPCCFTEIPVVSVSRCRMPIQLILTLNRKFCPAKKKSYQTERIFNGVFPPQPFMRYSFIGGIHGCTRTHRHGNEDEDAGPHIHERTNAYLKSWKTTIKNVTQNSKYWRPLLALMARTSRSMMIIKRKKKRKMDKKNYLYIVRQSCFTKILNEKHSRQTKHGDLFILKLV